ncbi:LysR family transcriptional regulator [Undibacterium sp. FT137W]|uniref:LysR family transcriptional regulator n=1 Tax=Undibacterium fentianense TaxID=2828728 RepID=A0A941II97_9BURK|nr:LysR family transcriptional regulator [Undibacterium fentianense]
MIEAKDIDLNLLVVFQEVFQERQISTVARKLNLSQPAVSNALARLRKTFNDPLFVRTSHGMQPTPLAQQLAEPVAAALVSITKALNQHDTFDSARSQRNFTIAMTDVGEMYFMPILIEQCRLLAPQIHLATVRANSIDLMAEMETGRIDLALGAFDEISGALYHRRLFQQEYVCLYRQHHPTMREGMNAKDFVQTPHLVVSTKESPYDKIHQAMEKAGMIARASFTVPHFASVPYIVSTTDLIAIVPQKLASSAAAPFRLQYCKPPLKLPSLQTNIFWHRRFAQDEGNQWLRQLLVRCFSDTNGSE